MQTTTRLSSNPCVARRIKVAHLALSFELGGAERLLVEFARHVDTRRFELHFLALSRDGAIGEQLRAAGFSATALNCPDGLRPGCVYRLARILRREKFDVLHTHLDRPHVYGTLAARLSRTPYVIHTRHGQGSELSARQRRLVRAMTRWTDQFVCVSRDAARRAATDHGIPASRIRTIWNGVDLNRFATTPVDPRGPIVTVARLSPEKDISNLLHAAALAGRDDTELCVEIAGDGPCRADLQRLADQLGMRHRVRFLGVVDDVAGLLTRASMFVLPSQTEGISLSILEALSRGVPVVATQVGGNVEVITDGENGLLVPARDPQALAAAIARLRRDPAIGQRLSQAGRKRIEIDFDVTQMVQHYQSLYTSLCGGGESCE